MAGYDAASYEKRTMPGETWEEADRRIASARYPLPTGKPGPQPETLLDQTLGSASVLKVRLGAVRERMLALKSRLGVADMPVAGEAKLDNSVPPGLLGAIRSEMLDAHDVVDDVARTLSELERDL